MRRFLWCIARLSTVGYGAFCLFGCVVADRMIFQPPVSRYTAKDEKFAFFANSEGRPVTGFYFAPTEEGGPVLLWSHGNAEDAGNVRSIGRRLNQRGIGFLSYDYPGYGLTPGRPSEKGSYRNAEAAFRYLIEKRGHKEQEIYLAGQSVGSGPSTYLAEQGKGAGLILVSPFKSAFRVVTKVKVVPWDRFDNWKRIPEVEQPLLVIHGEEDGVVPFSHGEALFTDHSGVKTFLRLPGVGHNDIWPEAGQQLEDAIVEFVNETASGKH